MKTLSTLRLALLSVLLTSFSFLQAQVVNVPDSNFKAALLANPAVNTNGDSEIQTSEASAFTGTLRVSNRNISDLTGIEAFTALTVLWCTNNNLTSLDLSGNAELTTLHCNHNQLTSLNVSSNLRLTDLKCHVNRLESLDVHNNLNLSVLLCFQNRLTELNLGLNEDLVQLQCSFNQITHLDVSGNTALTSLDVRKNMLVMLNVKNGNNTNFTTFNTTINPDLFCIQVDNPAYSEANWHNTDPRVFFSTDCAGSVTDIVNIPDANFKSALVNNPQINRNNDLEIQVGEASVYTGAIKVSGRNIADLTGIEAFTALTSLECSNNMLTTLDVSQNTSLANLRCDHAGLTSLVLGANANLRDVRIHYNELTTLDVSGNSGLVTLWCFGNKLSTLDAGNNSMLADLRANHNQLTSLVLVDHPYLQTLYLYSNQLTAFDVTGAHALADLRFNLNKISSIDLSANASLTYLNAGDNLITALSLTGNTALKNLLIYNNKLISLDLRGNSQLTELYAEKNPLTALTVRTGNNELITYFNTLNTPQLACIEVDDPAWSQANWPLVHPNSTFRTDCGWETEEVVNIPDANFKAALVANNDINRNGDGEIQVSEASSYTGQIQVSSKNIVDMTGIEAFTAATQLNCGDNQIRSLYLDKNVGLTQLDAFHNQINVIWFGSLPMLRSVNLDDNQIHSIDLRELPELWSLEINNNVLTALNVSSNPRLDYLGCGINQLTSLDVSANHLLRGLGCSQNLQMTNLNVKNGNNVNMVGFQAGQNPALHCIQVDDITWAEANWRDNVDAQATFSTDCGGSGVVYIPDPLFKQRVLDDNAVNTNGDGEIQVSEANTFTGFLNLDACGMSDATGLEAFTAITGLDIQHNNLTTLDLSANVALRNADCGQNQLTSVKINVGMVNFACYYNLITSLDLNGNNTLEYLDALDNKLSSLDLSSLGSTIHTLSVEQNPITSLNVSAMTNLRRLWAGTTKLSTIDVSANHILEQLSATNNPDVVTINAQNGNNTNMELYATSSPNLRCVQVDDVDYAEANFQVDPTTNFSLDCSTSGNVVYIPDPNLKAALLSFPDVNTNNDSEIQVIEAQSYDDFLPLSNRGISDPTGLQEFTAARFLDISRNNLTSLDVRPMTALDYLDCSFNQLTSLLWVNTLGSLSCTNNQLTSLDLASTPWVSYVYANFNPLGSLDLSQSTDLRQLGCSNCGLSSLDISQNPLLEWLDVNENQLTALDVSANPVLASLNVDDNQLTELDLSENPEIYLLWCNRNQLTELDLDGLIHLEEFGCSSNHITTLNVGNAPAILTFLCDDNRFASLDVSGAPNIATFRCQNNPWLRSLNMKNQGAQEYYTVDGRNCPNLHCVDVSDVAFAQEYWSDDFDPGVTFSTDCFDNGPVVYIPDWNMKNALIWMPDINTNGDAEIQVSEAQAYRGTLRLVGTRIADATGVEAFTGISRLQIGSNDLTSLDVSAITGLVALECTSNKLTSLIWNTSLRELRCDINQLTSLNFSGYPNLAILTIGYNPMPSLDVSQLPALVELACAYMGLTTLDLTQNPRLQILRCPDNQLTTLDLSGNPDLRVLGIDTNNFSSIDLSTNNALETFSCGYNQFTELDMSNRPALQALYCLSNPLTSLKVSGPNVVTVWCNNNLLTSLDMSGTPNLHQFQCMNNRLTSLNLRNLEGRDHYLYEGQGNPDLQCIEVSDVAFAEAHWTNSFDPGVSFSTDCGGSEAAARMSVSVYPNPTTDKLTIESSEPVDRVSIFDATGGRLMGTQTGNSVDMSSYQKGIYLISVQHGGQVTPVRIVKE